MDKDLRKLIRELEKQDFTVRRTRDGHYEVRKDGKRITTFSGTASDPRALKNGIAHCKRAGFIWPPK